MKNEYNSMGIQCRLLVQVIMIVPMFVNLQGFTVDKRFVVREVAILRRGKNLFLPLHFYKPYTMESSHEI